jgi:hypothetical protein
MKTKECQSGNCDFCLEPNCDCDCHKPFVDEEWPKEKWPDEDE